MPGPFIDTSILLSDPQFTDTISVVNRVQNIGANGRPNPIDTQTDGVLAVVTPARPADLKRLPDDERGHRTIKIFTKFRLNSAAQTLTGVQRQPDYVLWHNDTFIVKECLPWTSYGPGWVRIIATSIDSIETVN